MATSPRSRRRTFEQKSRSRRLFFETLEERSLLAIDLVSIGLAAPSNGTSINSAISADGRYVAFSSEASNLITGDTNGFSDIFVRDLVAGKTTRVGVADNGSQGNNGSFQPSIS